jgi:putative membrane protein
MVSEQAAEAFLGTQGDIWDTQSDMAFALIGAMLALVFMGRIHDRQLDQISNQPWGRFRRDSIS